ncbi:carboxypeptidase-like regulatory domain-containing protein [Fluviicola chungangensis]|uniref:Carboxypeptidase regulatory-like domain-containing protein n=1 Tax=Fluviicola chungangensis TaxID=2597671 RepID=A0A556MJA9_9FLAO|nr:carboxypeptidase-like regulatory domain-containing protein [Fluviicola chungangensis]TSJ40001.1 carboxypeptidase regulatory-like domain-containing protein [Fluviicola chungangensis]
MNRLFLIILLFSVSCTKFGKNMTVKGRVLNPITGEGISNVPVIIYRSTLDYPSGSKRVKETTTDSDGYFEISKASLSKCYLTCHVTEVGDYYPIGWEKKDDVPLFDAFTISVKKGKTMHADYYAVPYGNLQINNTSCFDSNDELKIYRTHSIPSFYDDVPNPAIYLGCVNQTGNMNKAPMGWYKYSGTVTKNGIVTPKKDSIYLNEGETKVWNINY